VFRWLFNNEVIMADNTTNRGSPDRDRINMNQDHEVRYWSQKFGVSAEELRKAVENAGSMAKDVEAYIKRH
jgi:hypothetical protein